MYKEFSSVFLFLSFLFMIFFLSNLFCSHPTIPFSLFPVFLRCNPGILSIPTQTRLPPCLCAGCNSTSPSSHYCFRHSLHFLFSFPFHSLFLKLFASLLSVLSFLLFIYPRNALSSLLHLSIFVVVFSISVWILLSLSLSLSLSNHLSLLPSLALFPPPSLSLSHDGLDGFSVLLTPLSHSLYSLPYSLSIFLWSPKPQLRPQKSAVNRAEPIPIPH
ncbi:unnamed protein product [Acanthosepion pharaonis]|uniref:Uncharacterized protein n=1 Tax=Acanthosepion pharaonis TaxID=158019 RepID=A0A812AQL6_ACAPH|nr:unnamed protein product [Sepia pharaonis]